MNKLHLFHSMHYPLRIYCRSGYVLLEVGEGGTVVRQVAGHNSGYCIFLISISILFIGPALLI